MRSLKPSSDHVTLLLKMLQGLEVNSELLTHNPPGLWGLSPAHLCTLPLALSASTYLYHMIFVVSSTHLAPLSLGHWLSWMLSLWHSNCSCFPSFTCLLRCHLLLFPNKSPFPITLEHNTLSDFSSNMYFVLLFHYSLSLTRASSLPLCP